MKGRRRIRSDLSPVIGGNSGNGFRLFPDFEPAPGPERHRDRHDPGESGRLLQLLVGAEKPPDYKSVLKIIV
jgi:hypothetical protein